MTTKPVTLMIAEPLEGTELHLDPYLLQTEPVTLRALLFHGEDDVTNKAAITWSLRWQASYKLYSRPVATGSPTAVRLVTGGEAIRATAVYANRIYHATVRIRTIGINPSRKQVSEKLGKGNLLRAFFWNESQEWRQFGADGTPLMPPQDGSIQKTARGIGQVVEYWWAEKGVIRHDDYPRLAWQWDYCITASCEILAHYKKRVRKHHPKDTEAKIVDRMLKTYKAGPKALTSAPEPGKFPYVRAVHQFMKDKPWEH